MSIIAANSNMHAVLSQAQEITEIRDPNGNVLGTFTPKAKADQPATKRLLLVCFEDGATVLLDPDRARQTLEREKGRGRPFRAIITELEETPWQEERGMGIPLAQVWKKLEARAK